MRIQSIDAIRGLAILGILFLNIAYHQNFHTGYAFFEEPLLSDEIISTFSALFLDGRFRTLFCLLFGAGLAIQFDACQKRGHNFLDFSKSRLKWLFLFGLIIFLGGLDFIRSLISGNAFGNFYADLSKIMMLITGLFFTYQCIRSFIHARKMRELGNSE